MGPLMHAPHDEQHGEPPPHPGEDFPRAELAYMVGRAQEAQARRRWLQVWAIAFGLGVFCLAAPTRRYFTALDWLWGFAGTGPTPHGLLGAPLLGLQWWSGWSLEQCAFLVSASFLVASFVALDVLLRDLGIPPERTLWVTVLAIFSPIVWLGGTLPMDYTAALFGATMLARSLFRTQQTHPYGYLWRTSVWLTVAFFLAAENLWLLCPAVWAVMDQPRERDQGWLRGIGLLSVFAVVLGAYGSLQAEPLQALRRALFGSGVRLTELGSLIPFVLLGFGVLLLGFVELFAGRREPEESPPPTWVFVWIAVALGPLLASGPAIGPKAAFLVPMAAVGFAVRGQRSASEGTALRNTLLAVCLQAVLTVGFWVHGREDYEQPDWSYHAARTLEANDGVISDSRAHAYLSAFRFELPTLWMQAGTVRHARFLERDPGPARWALDATQTPPEPFYEQAERWWQQYASPPPDGVVWLQPIELLDRQEPNPE